MIQCSPARISALRQLVPQVPAPVIADARAVPLRPGAPVAAWPAVALAGSYELLMRSCALPSCRERR